MKTKYAIVACAGVAVALVLTLGLKTRDKVTREVREPGVAKTAPPSSGALQVSSANLATSRTQATPEATYTKFAAAKHLLELYNHKPIEFFGLVLDQNDNAVAGVDVYGSIIYNTGGTGGTSHRQAKTDHDGRFYIGSVMGRSLNIGLAKKGYKYGGDQPQFNYTDFVPDHEKHHPYRERPVVFRMWKLQGPEPLVDHHKVFRVPNDGKCIRIDLRNGKLVSEEGDVLVCLHYDQTENERFDWNAEVVVPGGGVLEAQVPYTSMFAAPPDDYKPTFAVRMDASSSLWRPDMRRTLYLKLRSDHYVKMSLDIGPHRLDTYGVATIQWAINPKTSSRVLEPPEIEESENR